MGRPVSPRSAQLRKIIEKNVRNVCNGMPPHDNKNIDDDVSDTILGNLMTINWVGGMAVRPFKVS